MLEELLLTILSQYHTTGHTCCLCSITTTLQTIPTCPCSIPLITLRLEHSINYSWMCGSPSRQVVGVPWGGIDPPTTAIIVAIQGLNHSTTTCSPHWSWNIFLLMMYLLSKNTFTSDVITDGWTDWDNFWMVQSQHHTQRCARSASRSDDDRRTYLSFNWTLDSEKILLIPQKI